MTEQMPDINKKLLELDDGELPPDGELGSGEFLNADAPDAELAIEEDRPAHDIHPTEGGVQ